MGESAIGVRERKQFGARRELHDLVVTPDRALIIAVLLLVGGDVELADRIGGTNGLRAAEILNRFVGSAFGEQGGGDVIFGDEVSLSDGERVLPEGEIVGPIIYLAMQGEGEGR